MKAIARIPTKRADDFHGSESSPAFNGRARLFGRLGHGVDGHSGGQRLQRHKRRPDVTSRAVGMDAKKLIRWILDLKGTNIWMTVLSPGRLDTGPQWACGEDQLPDRRNSSISLSAGRGGHSTRTLASFCHASSTASVSPQQRAYDMLRQEAASLAYVDAFAKGQVQS